MVALLVLLAALVTAAGCASRAGDGAPGQVPAGSEAPSTGEAGDDDGSAADQAPTDPAAASALARLGAVDRVEAVHSLSREGTQLEGAEARRLVELLAASAAVLDDGSPAPCYGELELTFYQGAEPVAQARAGGADGCPALLRVGMPFSEHTVLRLTLSPAAAARLLELAAASRPAPRPAGRQAAPAVAGEGGALTAWRPVVAAPGVGLRVLEDLPEAFRPAAWLSGNRFVGMAKGGLALVDAATGKHRSVGPEPWDLAASPKGDRVLVVAGDRLRVVTADGGEAFTLPASGPSGQVLAGGLWAPDGSRLLVWETTEWDAEYYLLQAEAGAQPRPVPTRLDGYFLTSPAGWLPDGRVLFVTRASARRDGTREYTSGYRSDLAVYDPESGEYRLVTGVEDGVYLEAAPDAYGRAPLLPDGRLLASRQRVDAAGKRSTEWVAVDGLAAGTGAGQVRITPLAGIPEGAIWAAPCGTEGALLYAVSDRGGDPEATPTLYRGTILGTTRFSLFLLGADGSRRGLADWLAESFRPPLPDGGCRQVLLGFDYSQAVEPLWMNFQQVYHTVLLELGGGAGKAR